jgi:hypothetical protein
VRVIKFNARAYAALEVGTRSLFGSQTLDEALEDLLAGGVIRHQEALIFAKHRGIWPGAPTNVLKALQHMGWRDLTMYECQYNSFHLEDVAAVTVAITDDFEPVISDEDQITLLRIGLLVAERVIQLVRDIEPATPVRCIISANTTNATFRFHEIRSGESWVYDDLDTYRDDLMIVADDQPQGIR